MSVYLPIKSILDTYGLGSHTSHVVSLLREGKDEFVEDILQSASFGLTWSQRHDFLSSMKSLITTSHLYHYILSEEYVYRVPSDDVIDPSATTLCYQLRGLKWFFHSSLASIAPSGYLTYYYQKLQNCSLYRCGVNGVPQKAFGGLPLSQCQATAQATRLIPDLQYKVLSYNLDLTLHLPPSDQSRVLKEVIGYALPLHRVAMTLQALREGDWDILRDMGELKAYYSTKYSPTEYCLRDIAWELDLNPDMVNCQALKPRFVSAVKRYQKTGVMYELRYAILSLFYRILRFPADVRVEDIDEDFMEERANIELITNMIEGRLKEKLTLV